MNTTTSLEEALALALKLAPRERLQLIERVASSVEREIEAPSSGEEQLEQHWGRNLLRLLDELGPIEMSYPEIEDPVEWVKQIRRDEREQRLGDWDKDE
ncbi:MAG: hypothetical protein H6672_08425 [Anaerolineaceae bacterium]|nr:hypothetical protein [Anaerolineaceae bacterium]